MSSSDRGVKPPKTLFSLGRPGTKRPGDAGAETAAGDAVGDDVVEAEDVGFAGDVVEGEADAVEGEEYEYVYVDEDGTELTDVVEGEEYEYVYVDEDGTEIVDDDGTELDATEVAPEAGDVDGSGPPDALAGAAAPAAVLYDDPTVVEPLPPSPTGSWDVADPVTGDIDVDPADGDVVAGDGVVAGDAALDGGAGHPVGSWESSAAVTEVTPVAAGVAAGAAVAGASVVGAPAGPVPAPAPAPVGSGGGKGKGGVIAAVVVVVLILGGVAALALGGGGGDDPSTDEVSAERSTTTQAEDEDEPTATTEDGDGDASTTTTEAEEESTTTTEGEASTTTTATPSSSTSAPVTTASTVPATITVPPTAATVTLPPTPTTLAAARLTGGLPGGQVVIAPGNSQQYTFTNVGGQTASLQLGTRNTNITINGGGNTTLQVPAGGATTVTIGVRLGTPGSEGLVTAVGPGIQSQSLLVKVP